MTEEPTLAAGATTDTLILRAWNVNGIRAARKKGLDAWIDQQKSFALGLQEVRASAEDAGADSLFSDFSKWDIRSADRKGYSGVALASRELPDEIETTLRRHEFDSEGRYQLFRFGRLSIANVYFPNGSGKHRDNSRVRYKLDFYRALESQLWQRVQAGEHVVVMGDFNTAFAPIDLARPKANERVSGFLAEERAELERWFAKGWVDTFRQHCKEAHHYTWWSQRQGARERNVGWRIDYIVCSPNAAAFLLDSGIDSTVLGSDHCPIWAEFEPRIVNG